MKNRCLTIFFVVMTLAISPQVWQKLGNLLDAIQHRAQVKILSLVLSQQESNDEVEPAATTIQTEHFASCQGSTFVQAQDDVQTKADSTSHKIRTTRHAADKSEKPETLAFNAQDKDAQGESLSHLNNIAREIPNQWTMRGASFAPRDFAMDKDNVAEALALPQPDSVAPVFVENVNFQLKVKKILDENKLTRQRVRCPLGKSIPPLPSS